MDDITSQGISLARFLCKFVYLNFYFCRQEILFFSLLILLLLHRVRVSVMKIQMINGNTYIFFLVYNVCLLQHILPFFQIYKVRHRIFFVRLRIVK